MMTVFRANPGEVGWALTPQPLAELSWHSTRRRAPP
jgi:hypothetical protein